ncbi:MAG: YisL family protein [Bacillus sp. (in: firmicutes)]
MTHMHITTWVAALILFFVAISLYKKGNQKGFKTTHMILRVVYLLIIATGGLMLIGINITGEYIGKVILGIIVIGLLEMVLVKMGKGKSVTGLSIALAIALILVITLGLRLPMGMDFF